VRIPVQKLGILYSLDLSHMRSEVLVAVRYDDVVLPGCDAV
jgi:hypothetical protein